MSGDRKTTVFLSYASAQRAIAETVRMAIKGLNADIFLDRHELEPGSEFDSAIRRAVQGSDMMVFLISPASVARGAYTLTELKFAMEQWDHPAGRVLPVMALPTPLADVPPYLQAVTILSPEGNLAAEVAAIIARWMGDIEEERPQRSDNATSAIKLGYLLARSLPAPIRANWAAHSGFAGSTVSPFDQPVWIHAQLAELTNVLAIPIAQEIVPPESPFEHDSFQSYFREVLAFFAVAIERLEPRTRIAYKTGWSIGNAEAVLAVGFAKLPRSAGWLALRSLLAGAQASLKDAEECGSTLFPQGTLKPLFPAVKRAWRTMKLARAKGDGTLASLAPGMNTAVDILASENRQIIDIAASRIQS